jgi:hypothetical protein
MTISQDASPRAPLPSEQLLYDKTTDFGTNYGSTYPSIWEPEEAMITTLLDASRKNAGSLVGDVKDSKRVKRARVINWTVFLLGFSMFAVIFAVAGVLPDSTDPEYDQAQNRLSALLVVWLVISAMWFGLLWRSWGTTALVGQELEERRQWLTVVGCDAAYEVIARRKIEARLHDPKKRDVALPFQPAGGMPPPQPYGVSHEGAENLCAQWMRYLGEGDAVTTQYVSDGGIDVASNHYVAQVKNYSGTVGVAEIRELAGVVSDDGRKPIFFTSGTYASGSIEFANRIGMPLFIYDATRGTLRGSNALADDIFRSGL